jgi:hypothetical protein
MGIDADRGMGTDGGMGIDGDMGTDGGMGIDEDMGIDGGIGAGGGMDVGGSRLDIGANKGVYDGADVGIGNFIISNLYRYKSKPNNMPITIINSNTLFIILLSLDVFIYYIYIIYFF